ncbi:hypothetical protein OIU85_007441 [Salix viminalis]|uniref:Uncharacterized protein n=1 Tax=Salix viminalis TaxID=40686 RepID=A0A9Q0P8Z8_SALVM|nr:hypothetical protein OIU85_007441 [Salix viminalis]
MEFQEAVTRLRIPRTIRKGAVERHHMQTEKHKWNILFHRSSSSKAKDKAIRNPSRVSVSSFGYSHEGPGNCLLWAYI